MTVALLAGCAAKQDQQAAAPPPPEVLVSQAVSRDVLEMGEYTGRVEAAETVDIRARVTGYLTQIAFTDGQEVKPGDLLFQIDDRPFKATLDNATGQKAQWVAQLARAKADVARYEKLVPTGAATPQDLDKAKADLGESTAAIQSAEATIERAQLDLEYATIKASLAGQISKASLSKGNLVRADNDVLTTIVSLDPIYVTFNVDERGLLDFREQSRAALKPNEPLPDVRSLKIPVLVGLANEKGYPHAGVINFSDNRVDPTTGTILVRGTFDNAQRVFKPGFFARVRVTMGEAVKSVLVTDRAIGTDQGQKYVYVVDDKSTAQYRPVKLGRLEDDGLRVVTEGLKAGETVIVTGIQRARPGKLVTPRQVAMPVAGENPATRPVAVAPVSPAEAKPAHASPH
jgi:RND family efflux transporter MFP subunit